MAFWKRSLAGPGYIILNILRIMNIISLLAVVAASSVMLVKTFVVTKFYFFDGVSHVITGVLGIFLIVTELPFFRGYFARNWPLLSQASGLVTLGMLMIVLGVLILGNLNKEATSQESLGLSFWQIVISSGILVSILGFINIILSYVFRTKSAGVTARMVRSYGAVAPQKVYEVNARTPRRSFHIGRSDTLPSYNTSPKSVVPEMQRSNTSHSYRPTVVPTRSSSVYTGTTRNGLNISGPINVDPSQFSKFSESEEIRRPDTAMHPAYGGGRF